MLRKHWDLDVWLRTRVQEEEVGMEGCRTGGRIRHGTQTGMVVGGQGGRWRTRLLGGVEKMGRVIIPQSYGCLPQHEYWLQSWTCPESRCFAWIKDIQKMLLICPTSLAWFGLVTFLTGFTPQEWGSTALSLLPRPPSIPCSCRTLLKDGLIFLPCICTYGSDTQGL